MKKMNKKAVIEILTTKDEHPYTYDQLARLTGYHPKYLINLSRQIKNGTANPIHGNTGRPTGRAVREDEKEDILKLFNKKYYKTVAIFYEDYLKSDIKPKRKYVTIAKIISKAKEDFKINEEFVYFDYFYIKKRRYFYAFNYPSGKLLFVNSNKNCYEAFTKLLKTIFTPEVMKIPFLENNKSVYADNILRILRKLEIKHDIPDHYYLDELIKKVKKDILTSNYTLKSLINSKPDYEFELLLGLHHYRKTISDNVFKWKNRDYEIITDEKIPRYEGINLITGLQDNKMLVEYNDKYYEIKRIEN